MLWVCLSVSKMSNEDPDKWLISLIIAPARSSPGPIKSLPSVILHVSWAQSQICNSQRQLSPKSDIIYGYRLRNSTKFAGETHWSGQVNLLHEDHRYAKRSIAFGCRFKSINKSQAQRQLKSNLLSCIKQCFGSNPKNRLYLLLGLGYNIQRPHTIMFTPSPSIECHLQLRHTH